MLQVIRIGVTKVDWDVVKVYLRILHMLQWLYIYVSIVCSKCFIYIRPMLQVFHPHVVKVDLHVTFTCMLQAYFQVVSGVSYIYCKYFIWMLYLFAMIFKYFSGVFCKCFRRMFKVFHLPSLYVVTVASEYVKSRSGVAHEMSVGSDWRRGPAARVLARKPNTLGCSLAR
jgi:hypothetical protein